MNRIHTALVEREVIHFKKDFLGWHVVHPWKNPNGTINWFNFLTGGSWWHLFIIIGIVLIIIGAVYEYTLNINNLISCFNDPITLEQCKQSFGYQDLVVVP